MVTESTWSMLQSSSAGYRPGMPELDLELLAAVFPGWGEQKSPCVHSGVSADWWHEQTRPSGRVGSTECGPKEFTPLTMIYNLETARQYAAEGRTSSWVQQYLRREPNGNLALAAALGSRDWIWTGPIEVELSLVRRTLGPETGMPNCEDELVWEARIAELVRGIQNVRELPPLILRGDAGQLTITDGNHRSEALRRLGFSSCWALVWHHS